MYWLVKKPDTKLYNKLNLTDVWTFQNLKRHKIHNATFPIELPYSILSSFEDAKVIVDPHMGVGTTAKAVIKVNKEDGRDMKYIGFDISKNYVDTANKEIDAMNLEYYWV